MARLRTDTCQRDIMFQNVRGLQETKLEELVSCMTSANLGAAILAETWRRRDSDRNENNEKRKSNPESESMKGMLALIRARSYPSNEMT